MALDHLEHPILKDILSICEDKNQGYTAFNLYIRLSEQYIYEKVQWKYDQFLKKIILETKQSEKYEIFLPLHYSSKPSPKWMRKVIKHLGENRPNISIHLGLSSSSQTFIMYRTSSSLEAPKNLSVEAMKKSRKDQETSSKEEDA